jgi:uncharacterized membrane protein YkoI
MTKSRIAPVLSAVLVASLAGCDMDGSAQELRESVAEGLAQADVALVEAIATAEAEGAGVAIDAELENEDGAFVYRIEVVAADGVRRIHVDSTSGAVTRNRLDDAADEEETAAATLATGADWAGIVSAAEAHVSGEAFEIEVEDGIFEVEVLTDDAIWEIEVSADGAVLEAEPSDDVSLDDDEDDDDGEDDDEDDDGEDDDEDDDGEDDDEDDDSDG